MTTEAEVRVMPVLEGGHKTRSAGSLEKLAEETNRLSPTVPEGHRPADGLISVP